MKIQVSVISTVKNEGESIKKLVNSLINQTFKPKEVIIVDGGSTDGTWEYLKKMKKKYTFLRCYQKPELNIAQGRNYAIKKTKCKLVASIDGGCYADGKWLENLVKRWVETKGDVIAGVFKPWIESEWDEIEGYFQCPDIRKLKDGWEPSSRSVLFTKKIWKCVGGYPEFTYTAEDTLFNRKLKDVGARYYLVKDAIVYWRMRRNLWKIFKQFYLYGKGDISVGTWKTTNKLIVTFLTLSFPFFIILEVLLRVRRVNLKHLLIGLFINLAKRYGYFIGVFSEIMKRRL